MQILPFAFSLLFTTFTIASAELPPYVYEEMRNETPEVVVAEILYTTASKVDRALQCENYADVVALVLDVDRSASNGLAVGDMVSFETYERVWDAPSCEGWAGPSPPGIMNPGECGRLYLKFQDNNTGATTEIGGIHAMELSAGGRSFERYFGCGYYFDGFIANPNTAEENTTPTYLRGTVPKNDGV